MNKIIIAESARLLPEPYKHVVEAIEKGENPLEWSHDKCVQGGITLTVEQHVGQVQLLCTSREGKHILAFINSGPVLEKYFAHVLMNKMTNGEMMVWSAEYVRYMGSLQPSSMSSVRDLPKDVRNAIWQASRTVYDLRSLSDRLEDTIETTKFMVHQMLDPTL